MQCCDVPQGVFVSLKLLRCVIKYKKVKLFPDMRVYVVELCFSATHVRTYVRHSGKK